MSGLANASFLKQWLTSGGSNVDRYEPASPTSQATFAAPRSPAQHSPNDSGVIQKAEGKGGGGPTLIEANSSHCPFSVGIGGAHVRQWSRFGSPILSGKTYYRP